MGEDKNRRVGCGAVQVVEMSGGLSGIEPLTSALRRLEGKWMRMK